MTILEEPPGAELAAAAEADPTVQATRKLTAEQTDAAWTTYARIIRKDATGEKLNAKDIAALVESRGRLQISDAQYIEHKTTLQRHAAAAKVRATMPELEAAKAQADAERDRFVAVEYAPIVNPLNDRFRQVNAASQSLADRLFAARNRAMEADDLESRHWRLFDGQNPAILARQYCLFQGVCGANPTGPNPRAIETLFDLPPNPPSAEFLRPCDGESQDDAEALFATLTGMYQAGRPARYIVGPEDVDRIKAHRDCCIMASEGIQLSDFRIRVAIVGDGDKNFNEKHLPDGPRFHFVCFPGQSVARRDELLAERFKAWKKLRREQGLPLSEK